MLSEYDMHKILDDLKRASRIIPILRDEKDKTQRERIAQLAIDELQKLHDDLEEIKKVNDNDKI